MRPLFLLAALLLFPARALATGGALRYGGDAEGGAPYTFYDPKDPGRLVGFEVDIADELGKRLGLKPEFQQNAWESLIPALVRGDSDIVINGIEVTPEHAAEVAFTRPYYVFQQQLTVRADELKIKSFSDLSGRRVGTLLGSLAQDMLGGVSGVQVVTYPGQMEPYEDLATGRIDAVLLDLPIAAYYAHPNPRLKDAGPPVGEGLYAIAIRKEDAALFAKVDGALGAMIADGTLHDILVRWNLWTSSQALLAEGRSLTEKFSKVSAIEMESAIPGSNPSAAEESASPRGREKNAPAAPERPDSWWRYVPALLAGAGVTFGISVVSMVLAIGLGLLIALCRLYGGNLLSRFAIAYIEIVRGTPLLIQLLLLYYGLPNLGVRLPALVAAVVGLGFNYAAAEAEIYRAGLLAIPRGQTDAALSLGMTRGQALRYVLLPQALRTVLPPVTNDFIAMLKDSSLVSVITVVELTKAYSIHAASTYSYLELGLLTAGLYLAISLPLARLSRFLEAKVHFAY
ncbi:MAG: ABC transporter substrate-binding protein/permease [Bdellovibrionota bacterium]